MGKHTRYAAFLSYSHRDSAIAARLHRALEAFRIPKSLGRFEIGEKVNRLFPVFRDKEEAASGELGKVLKDALDNSNCLIVICSPNSARSPWVEQEIRYFQSLGRSDRVFAVIVAGQPNVSAGDQPDLECLPASLRSGSANLATQGPDPNLLAADIRKGRDSFRTAVLRIAAGTIGVNLGRLLDRYRRRRKQAARLRLAAAFLVLSVVLSASLAGREVFRRETFINAANAVSEDNPELALALRVAAAAPDGALIPELSESTLPVQAVAAIVPPSRSIHSPEAILLDARLSPHGAYGVFAGQRDLIVRTAGKTGWNDLDFPAGLNSVSGAEAVRISPMGGQLLFAGVNSRGKSEAAILNREGNPVHLQIPAPDLRYSGWTFSSAGTRVFAVQHMPGMEVPVAWNVADGTVGAIGPAPSAGWASITGVLPAPDGRLALLLMNAGLWVWDADAGSLIQLDGRIPSTLERPEFGRITGAFWSPDSSTIVTVTRGEVRVLSAHGQEIWSRARTNSQSVLAFSDDASIILFAEGRQLTFLNAATGQRIGSYPYPMRIEGQLVGRARAVRALPGGRFAIADDSGQLLFVEPDQSFSVARLAYGPLLNFETGARGDVLAVDADLALHYLSEGAARVSTAEPVRRLWISSDGRLALGRTLDGPAFAWDLEAEKQTVLQPPFPGKILEILPLMDGAAVFALLTGPGDGAGSDRAGRAVFSTSSGELISHHPDLPSDIVHVEADAGGNRVAVRSAGQGWAVFDQSSAEVVFDPEIIAVDLDADIIVRASQTAGVRLHIPSSSVDGIQLAILKDDLATYGDGFPVFFAHENRQWIGTFLASGAFAIFDCRNGRPLWTVEELSGIELVPAGAGLPLFASDDEGRFLAIAHPDTSYLFILDLKRRTAVQVTSDFDLQAMAFVGSDAASLWLEYPGLPFEYRRNPPNWTKFVVRDDAAFEEGQVFHNKQRLLVRREDAYMIFDHDSGSPIGALGAVSGPLKEAVVSDTGRAVARSQDGSLLMYDLRMLQGPRELSVRQRAEYCSLVSQAGTPLADIESQTGKPARIRQEVCTRSGLLSVAFWSALPDQIALWGLAPQTEIQRIRQKVEE